MCGVRLEALKLCHFVVVERRGGKWQ